jgi:formamidopyrimidine-DNA glycosylase
VPELPEVETVVRDLRPLLVGRRLAAVAQVSGRRLRKPWQLHWDGLLVGQLVAAVARRGKWIVLRLEGERCLVVHLGMTGQLTVAQRDDPLATHTHLTFDLAEESGEQPLSVGRIGNPSYAGAGGASGEATQLRFRDVRRFGSATLFDSAAELTAFFEAAGLGPEPFDLTPKYWRQRLAATTRCLKAVLLDQGVVAGVGNIYADESLFQARLHPARRACDLARAEAERLRKAIPAVLEHAIECRGSSIRDYVGGSGLRGGYQNEFRAYGRAGEPCPRCRAPIAATRLAGRATHFCPSCQPSAVSSSTSADGSSLTADG